MSLAVAREIDRWVRAKEADPIGFYRPAPIALALRDAIDSGANEIHVNGANRTSKSEAMVFISAGLLLGRDAEWLPRLRPKWRGMLQILLVVPTLTQALGDVLLKLHRRLPEAERWRVGLSGHVTTLSFPRGTIHVVSWASIGLEAARQKIAGLEAHVAWVNEECPSEIFGEVVARGAAVDPVRVITATMGLELLEGRQARLDPSFFRERAQSGVACGKPWCQHVDAPSSDVVHLWVEFDAASTPWMTALERDRYIASLPAHEREVRLGRSWGRLPTGRMWPTFAEGVHVLAFELADVAAAASGEVRLALTVDCGSTDAEAAVLEAWCREACPTCGIRDGGYERCRACERTSRRGCEACAGSGRPGWVRCLTCGGTGCFARRWTLAEYQSEPGRNGRVHNATGILGMLSDAGVVLGGGPAPDLLDDFIGDNMAGGKGEAPRADGGQRTELELLRDALQAAVPPSPNRGTVPRHRPAVKWISKHKIHAQGDALFGASRWHVHPRCRRIVQVLQHEAYAKDGSLPKHDGPQGRVHLRNCLEYATALMTLPQGGMRSY